MEIVFPYTRGFNNNSSPAKFFFEQIGVAKKFSVTCTDFNKITVSFAAAERECHYVLE
jgi:hypothetical protein